MNDRRFEITITMDARDTTSPGGGKPPAGGGETPEGDPFFKGTLCYSGMPYEGLLAIEREMIGVQQRLLEMGYAEAGAAGAKEPPAPKA